MPVKTLGYSPTASTTNVDLDALATAVANAAGNAATALTAANEALDSFPQNESRTVAALDDYLANNAVYNVKDYGALADGTSDNATEIQAALTAAAVTDGTVYVPAGATFYGILSALTIPANVTLTGPGEIRALAAFTNDYMFLMEANSTLAVRTVDGSGMPVPVAAWTGAGVGLARAPVGCAVFINGASGSEIRNCTIATDTFQNFPSGPICGFYCDDLIVSTRRYLTVQTYTSNETNAVLGANNALRVRYNGGRISGYNWKGFYFANCTDCVGTRCYAENGATGHAAHYDSDGTRNLYIACGHDGTSGGDGYKATDSASPSVKAYTSKSSTGAAVVFDACTDYELDGLHATDPANTGVYLDTANGDLLRGRVSNWFVHRTSQGTTGNHVAVKLVPSATDDIDGLVIGPGIASNGFYGISCLPVAGAVVANVVLSKEIQYRTNAQYDIIGYFKSVDVQGGNIVRSASSGSGTDVFISTQATVTGQLCRIGKLVIEGFGAAEIMVEVTGTWNTVIVDGLTTHGGGQPFKATAGNLISNLFIPNLYAYDAGQTTAVDLEFDQAVTTRLIVGNVDLPTAAGGERFIGVAVSGSAVTEGYGVQTLTDQATIAINPHNGTDFKVTLGGNRTVGAPSNPITGQQINLTVVQDGTGGRTLAWNAVFKQSWSDTGNTLGLRSSISFIYDGTNWNQISAQTPYV